MVATINAGHNKDGFKLTKPSNKGSDPSGINVAANKDAANKTANPHSGCDKFVNRV